MSFDIIEKPDEALSVALDLNGHEVEQTAKAERVKFEKAYERIRACLGPVFCEADEDDNVIEIMLNDNSSLFIDRLGKGMEKVGTISPAKAKAAMRVLAALMNKEFTASKPLLEGHLPWNGARLAAQAPPVVNNTAFTIRKKAIAVFTLTEYVEADIIKQEHFDLIRELIKQRKNILVVGSTGSGKTTLTNALINEISTLDSESRIIIIEDTGEIQCTAENHVSLRTTEDVTYHDLLKITLRMRPDRIIVGEVRDHVALDMLDAWNTGHEGGVCTVHANDCIQALLRLESLVNRNQYAPRDVKEVISQAVHAIIFIHKTKDHGRRVDKVLVINGYDKDRGIYDHAVY